MIILPVQTEVAARGYVSMEIAFRRLFGRAWVAAWILSGILACAGWVGTFWLFMPEIVEWPSDGIEIILIGIGAALCLMLGPSALGGVLFVFVILAVYNFLLG